VDQISEMKEQFRIREELRKQERIDYMQEFAKIILQYEYRRSKDDWFFISNYDDYDGLRYDL